MPEQEIWFDGISRIEMFQVQEDGRLQRLHREVWPTGGGVAVETVYGETIDAKVDAPVGTVITRIVGTPVLVCREAA